PGTLTAFVLPGGPGVRIDSGVEAGSVVGGRFDSLLGKLIVTGRDRDHALGRARRALAELRIEGLPTVVPFHRWVVEHPDFVGDGRGFAVHTRWIEENYVAPPGTVPDPPPDTVAVRVGTRELSVRLPGLALLRGTAATSVAAAIADRSLRDNGEPARSDVVRAPMQGMVVGLSVE